METQSIFGVIGLVTWFSFFVWIGGWDPSKDGILTRILLRRIEKARSEEAEKIRQKKLDTK